MNRLHLKLLLFIIIIHLRIHTCRRNSQSIIQLVEFFLICVTVSQVRYFASIRPEDTAVLAGTAVCGYHQQVSERPCVTAEHDFMAILYLSRETLNSV